jgi:hypothetical protein
MTLGGTILLNGLGGLILGLSMAGGLLIASHFFDTTPARFVFGIIFGLAITASIVGVLFAGCMCLAGAANSI